MDKLLPEMKKLVLMRLPIRAFVRVCMTSRTNMQFYDDKRAWKNELTRWKHSYIVPGKHYRNNVIMAHTEWAAVQKMLDKYEYTWVHGYKAHIKGCGGSCCTLLSWPYQGPEFQHCGCIDLPLYVLRDWYESRWMANNQN